MMKYNKEDHAGKLADSYRAACVFKDLDRMDRTRYIDMHFELVDMWLALYHQPNPSTGGSERWDNRRVKT